MSKRGWYGVDFDGTLAHYEGFEGPLQFGNPIPKMQERVKEWIASGREVKIFTARVSGTKGDRDVEQVREAISNWCLVHLGKKLEVTNEKDFGLIELWDDRAVGVVKNTGERVGDSEVNERERLVLIREYAWLSMDDRMPEEFRFTLDKILKLTAYLGNDFSSVRHLDADTIRKEEMDKIE